MYIYICICAYLYSCVWYESFMRVTGRIHVCGMLLKKCINMSCALTHTCIYMYTCLHECDVHLHIHAYICIRVFMYVI